MSKKYAYAYETGYRDGSVNYELEHCPACKNVANLQEALAENAELRKLASRLYANLRNRETILELMMMPPTEAVKDEMRAIVNKCRELGIEIEKGE